MKYIDADKLRAEIERLMKEIRGYDDWTLGFESACEIILNAIDTMPDEEPVTDCRDLEEAASKYATDDNNWFIEEEKLAFKAGAEWMAKQLPLPEDTVIFQKGVEEGKRLMMEGAVDADVMLTLHDKTGDVSIHTGYLPKDLGIKCDSKVKIIIVKEGEK